MKTTVHGASDDLIEINGGISEEFNFYDGVALLAFSDGTLLEMHYDNDGLWRIRILAQGSCAQQFTPGSVVNDSNDVLTLEGDLAWCCLGERGQYNPAYAKSPPVEASTDKPGPA